LLVTNVNKKNYLPLTNAK